MSSKVTSGKGGKKKELSSSSSSGSESESDNERTTKKTVAKPAAKKQPPAKGKSKQSESDSSSSSSSSESSSESESDDDKKKKKPAAKKPAAKKNAKKKDASSSESDSDSDADTKKKKPAAKKGAVPEKKKAEPAKPANAFAGLGDDDEDESHSESDDDKPAAKKKASSVEPSEDESDKNAKGKGKGGKAAPKGKGAKPAAGDDDLDDILNDLSIAPKDGADGEAGMSKAQLKRLRQKQKQEAEKNAAPEAAAAPAAAAAAAPAADAKKKDEKKKEAPAGAKGNKAVEALKEKLRLQKEEEEKRLKEEEDRIAAIEAERIRLEEEAKREAEEKAARQAARAKAREQARAEGKLLSKTEKAALAKRQAFLKQLEASGQMLPAALLEQRKKDEATLAAAAAAGDAEAAEAAAAAASPSPEAAAASAAAEAEKKQSKKDQRSKGKSAFGKRLEAQKEAEKIRAERYANEDAARKAVKEEEERRKVEDAALAAKSQAALEAVDKEEKEVEDTPIDVEEEEEQDDEPIADSWEELDSEEERRKETEKEARRAAKSAEKAAAIKAKEDKLAALQKKKDDIIKARDAEAAELKKKRQAADDIRKKKEEEERKKKEEAERQAKAVEQGFEMEREVKPDEGAAQSSSGKESKRKGELRSPIGCILGHVDTGKCWGLGTKLMQFDGTSIKVEELVAASEQGKIIQLMGDDNTPRTVQLGSAIRGNTGAEAAQFDPTPQLELLPLRFSWREGDRGTNGFVCKYHGCTTEVHSLSALRTHMSDDSLHTALLPPIEPGMYRITSAHQGRDSWTCNADHILVVVFTRPPTNVRRHQRQQAHNLPWHFTSLEARFDRKKGNLVIEQDYSFSTESEAETARAAYMKTWQPLVWEGSVAHYLRCEPSVQKQGRMYQPANVQFELEGESLSERLSNVLGVAASEQQVLETATMIGRWIASGVDAASNTVLTSLLHSYRMMGNKRLPRELSTESREVRMALLSGMIEASSEIVAQQRTTLDGYVHLARGLGFCTGKPSLASGNWRVTINEQPSKRADEWSQRSAEFTVQKIAHDNYYGFTVDGNGRFLMDDFVVTHNTKILDKIRQSNVQSHEAGGITQQIGCTWMPRQKILEKTAELCEYSKKELKMDVPGLLMVDTPGHESFTNLRSRGSNLCDIAILVVDIMHGLEPQTIESINLLKQRKTPFIIALNKIDRCYGWKTTPDCPLLKTLANQSDSTRGEFEKRMKEAMLLLSQQGLNTVPYYENPDFRKYISIVPTSAITGEGIPDLLMLLVTLTQQMMNERLTFNNELKCTVLDVKVIEGLGTTIDVILVNGTLEEGQTIVVCGLNGPIVTTVRALLTPPPMHEMRVKADYVHHKVIKAAMGVKISAQGLEQAVAGTSLMVVGKKDNIEELKDEVQSDLATILSKVDKSGQGVAVQASTLGSLEALLSFLEDMKIPVSCINIGPVYKKDIMKAAVMLERRPEYGVLLAFDVKVAPDAQKLADEMGVKIFTADIIYHLFDSCTKYMEEVKAKKRAESAEVAVFPVVLDILPNAIFNVKSPIVLGVRVTEGVARIGTPICIPSKSFLFIGKITGIQKNHVDFTEAKKGEEFACKLEQSKSDQQVVFGRQFDASCQLVSRITRESIDLLKANFKDDVSDAEWKLIIKLKKIFDIM